MVQGREVDSTRAMIFSLPGRRVRRGTSTVAGVDCSQQARGGGKEEERGGVKRQKRRENNRRISGRGVFGSKNVIVKQWRNAKPNGEIAAYVKCQHEDESSTSGVSVSRAVARFGFPRMEPSDDAESFERTCSPNRETISTILGTVPQGRSNVYFRSSAENLLSCSLYGRRA